MCGIVVFISIITSSLMKIVRVAPIQEEILIESGKKYHYVIYVYLKIKSIDIQYNQLWFYQFKKDLTLFT